jgi:hypothetical protein
MTDRRLQKGCVVTGLQPLVAYNVIMSLPANELPHSTRRVTGVRQGPPRISRAGLVIAALLATAVLVTGCGGGSSGSSTAQGGSSASLQSAALRYTDCMRTHGEPNMPDPTFTGGHATLDITPGSGVDPSSPQFAAASKACQHLVKKGGAPSGPAITPAAQSDYLKAVACMRSHGFPGFPDPVFQNNTVTFSATGTHIDTNSPEYKRALTTCRKLVPAGLPYSTPAPAGP